MGLNKQKGNMYGFISHTFNAIKGECPHQCHYCLTGETNILMHDFTTKKIRDIRPGDKIVGISKTNSSGFYKFGEHRVVSCGKRKEKTIIIGTKHGTIRCTKDHPLMGSTEARNCTDWKSAGAFSVYENLRFIGTPSDETHTRDIGWLSGFCDGDGCIFKHGKNKKYLGFEAVCVDEKLMGELISRCRALGISLRKGTKRSSEKSFNNGKPNPMVHSRKTETAKRLKAIIRFGENKHENFYLGYLAGMIDSDGSTSGSIRIAQSKTANRVKYDRIKFCCERLGFSYKEERSGIRILGGFMVRSRILLDAKPQHSVKSKNLLYGMSVKGSAHSEIISILPGGYNDVYNIETTSGNYIANGFIVHNCYMKRFKNQKPVRFDKSELKTDLGEHNFIFVGSSCDMFAEGINCQWIKNTLAMCNTFPFNQYLFQSKNPFGFFTYQRYFPPHSTFCTAIETNRHYRAMGNAPPPAERARAMGLLPSDYKRMVTIEPIMDFDVDRLYNLIFEAFPAVVNIGANTMHGIKLKEPSKDKISALIEKLDAAGFLINTKPNLKRIYPVPFIAPTN